MKRRRRTSFPREAVHSSVERDEATGIVDRSVRGAGRRYANLGMPHERDERPHERDERPHAPGEPSPVTTHAADDLAEGRRNTDLYAKVGRDFDRKARRS
jgi:hypothetical protein